MLCVGAFAQGQKNEKHHAEKIAYLTHQMQLSADEAKVFWPVYEEFDKARMEAMAAARQARKALRESLAPAEDGSVRKDSKDKLDSFLEAQGAVQKVSKDYCAKFLKVLPADKVAKFYLAEERHMQKQLKQGPRKGKAGKK